MKLCSLDTSSGDRRRAPLTLTMLVTGALLLSACGAGGSSTSGAGDSDGDGDADTLTVLVEGGGKAELEPVAAKFTEETGTEIVFVELPYDGLYDRLSTELASGNVSFDVAALDAIWLRAFADGVSPLDSVFTQEVVDDTFPALLQEAQVDDRFVGVPAWTNAQVLFYRTDLLEDPTHMAAFKAEYGYDLAPPTTWEQYRDVAKFFTQDTDGDGATDLYGTDVKGAVETEWLAMVLQAGADGMVLDENGMVIINDAAHLEALEYYVAPLIEDQAAPPGAAQRDWGEAQNGFYQGQTAMMRFWAHAYTQTPEDSPVLGNIGVVPMPAGPAGLGGVPGAWYLSVPTATDKQELATEFIAFAYANNELGLDTSLGLAASETALASRAGEDGMEHLQALIDTLEAPATKPRPATEDWQEIVDTVLTPMLQKAVESGASQQLLDDAKTQIEQILE